MHIIINISRFCIYITNRVNIINDIKNIKVQKNIKILIAGLTYKPDVPDLRNSLAIDIFKLIKKNNKNTDGFDPIINNKSRIKMKLEKDIKISKYDRIYVLTEHNVFKKKTLIKNKKIVYVFKDLQKIFIDKVQNEELKNSNYD